MDNSQRANNLKKRVSIIYTALRTGNIDIILSDGNSLNVKYELIADVNSIRIQQIDDNETEVARFVGTLPVKKIILKAKNGEDYKKLMESYGGDKLESRGYYKPAKEIAYLFQIYKVDLSFPPLSSKPIQIDKEDETL